GVAALMYQVNPTMSPNVAKATLLNTSTRKLFTATGLPGSARGLVNAKDAVSAAAGHKFDLLPANVGLVPSTGLGSLEASRGSVHVYADLDGDGVAEPVTGEVDVLAQPWGAASWGAASWGAASWGANA